VGLGIGCTEQRTAALSLLLGRCCIASRGSCSLGCCLGNQSLQRRERRRRRRERGRE
jgi:hypothetical protein